MANANREFNAKEFIIAVFNVIILYGQENPWRKSTNGCYIVQYVSLLFTKTNLCFTNYDVKDRQISSLRGLNWKRQSNIYPR